MINKLAYSLALIIFLGLIIILINPNFKFVVLFDKLQNFPNLFKNIGNVSFSDAPQIHVPNINGFSAIARGINFILSALYGIAEFAISLVRIVPSLARNLIEIISYCLGF